MHWLREFEVDLSPLAIATQPLLVIKGARLCFNITSQWDEPKGEETSEEAVDQGRGGAEKPHGKGCWDETSSIQEGEEETVKSDESEGVIQYPKVPNQETFVPSNCMARVRIHLMYHSLQDIIISYDTVNFHSQ